MFGNTELLAARVATGNPCCGKDFEGVYTPFSSYYTKLTLVLSHPNGEKQLNLSIVYP